MKKYLFSTYFLLAFAAGVSLSLKAESELRSPETTAEVQSLIIEARNAGKKITIAGAGKGSSVKNTQTDSIILNQDHMSKILKLDVEHKKITLQPGVTWAEVQDGINGFGLSIAAMQSYCDFSVGGALGVNAHGQDFRYAPVAQTIESMVIVDAAGEVKRLSRTENSELFHLVIGGYGLFGVVTEVTLKLTDNTMLIKEVAVEDNATVFGKASQTMADEDIALYSARFDMGSRNFMDRILTIGYRDTHEKTTEPLKTIGAVEDLRGKVLRKLFNISRNWSFLRNIRTAFEAKVIEGAFYAKRSRNNAMYYKTSTLEHNDDGKIEILQEYFMPVDQAQQFIDKAKKILQDHGVDVLNCTLRYVKKDDISFLPYAPQTVAALVFFYSIDNDKDGFDYAQVWTRKLVDAAIESDGRFYLPYHCFATKDQIRSAYPEFDAFIEQKKKYDPDELFVNDLYLVYK